MGTTRPKDPRRQAASYKRLATNQRTRVRYAMGVLAGSVLLIALAFIRDWHFVIKIFGFICLVSSLIQLRTETWRARDFANRQSALSARGKDES